MTQDTYLGLLLRTILIQELKKDGLWRESGEKLKSTEDNALDKQVGGSHYKQYKIQPVEYAMANNLNYCQANAIKYVTRYRDKGGIEDLRKAIHNIEILIELEQRNDDRQGDK